MLIGTSVACIFSTWFADILYSVFRDAGEGAEESKCPLPFTWGSTGSNSALFEMQ